MNDARWQLPGRLSACRRCPLACPGLAEEPVNRAAGHPQLAGNGCPPPPAGDQLLHPQSVEALLAAPVRALALRHRDALELPLAAHVGFKGSEDGQHAEECPASGARSIDALFEDLEVCSCLLDLMG